MRPVTRRRANRGLSLREGVLAVAGAMRPRATPRPQKRTHTVTKDTEQTTRTHCAVYDTTRNRTPSLIHSFIHSSASLTHARNVHAQRGTSHSPHGCGRLLSKRSADACPLSSASCARLPFSALSARVGLVVARVVCERCGKWLLYYFGNGCCAPGLPEILDWSKCQFRTVLCTVPSFFGSGRRWSRLDWAAAQSELSRCRHGDVAEETTAVDNFIRIRRAGAHAEACSAIVERVDVELGALPPPLADCESTSRVFAFGNGDIRDQLRRPCQ